MQSGVFTAPVDGIDAYRRLLGQLPDVFAVGIHADEDGIPTEIHILASSKRAPKQIARDIQSALFAAYGLEIDHRIISIAQMDDNPLGAAPASGSARLALSSLEARMDGDLYTVCVTLTQGGQAYVGESTVRSTPHQRIRAAAQATLDAVHAFLKRECFTLLEVKQTMVWGESILVSVIENACGRDAGMLVGAAAQGENLPLGVVHSTLDALNRVVARMEPSA